jgi:hypothetical protein
MKGHGQARDRGLGLDRCGVALLNCIVACSHQMQRHIGFVSDNPTVVPGRYVENVARLHFNDAAVVHRVGVEKGSRLKIQEIP